MAIIKIKKQKGETKGFTQIYNSTLQDKNLSFRARGVLNYLLSKPENWKPNIRDLVKNGKENRHHILSAYKELQMNGYMKIERIRGEGGKISQVKHTIFEQSQGENYYKENKASKDSAGQDKGNGKPKSDSETKEGQKPKSDSTTKACPPQNEPLKDSTGQALNPEKPKSQKPKSGKPKSDRWTNNNNRPNNNVSTPSDEGAGGKRKKSCKNIPPPAIAVSPQGETHREDKVINFSEKKRDLLLEFANYQFPTFKHLLKNSYNHKSTSNRATDKYDNDYDSVNISVFENFEKIALLWHENIKDDPFCYDAFLEEIFKMIKCDTPGCKHNGRCSKHFEKGSRAEINRDKDVVMNEIIKHFEVLQKGIYDHWQDKGLWNNPEELKKELKIVMKKAIQDLDLLVQDPEGCKLLIDEKINFRNYIEKIKWATGELKKGKLQDRINKIQMERDQEEAISKA